MMEWYNKFTPGFMCVRRKPHTFGNERHIVLCGITSILLMLQIVEGEYRLAQLGPNLHSDLGITAGLMLWMYEPIFYTEKYVLTDIGFCVTNGIIALAAKGVYDGALIKKHWN